MSPRWQVERTVPRIGLCPGCKIAIHVDWPCCDDCYNLCPLDLQMRAARARPGEESAAIAHAMIRTYILMHPPSERQLARRRVAREEEAWSHELAL